MARLCVIVGTVVALVSSVSPAEAADPLANGWVVWASDRKSASSTTGQASKRRIFMIRADGTNIQQLTDHGAKFPAWSPDGSWIAYTHIAEDSTHVMRWDKSEDKQVCDRPFLFWMHDGSGLVCGRKALGSDQTYSLVNPDTKSSKTLFKRSTFTKLGTEKFTPGGITHDGRYLLAHSGWYDGGRKGDNGVIFGGTEDGVKVGHNAAIILDFNHRNKVYFLGYGCEPTTAPAGDWIYHVRGDGLHPTAPDIFKMRIKNTEDILARDPNDGRPDTYQAEVQNADNNWGHEYFPRISTDNRWLTYGSSDACHSHTECDYDVFLHKLGSSHSSRIRLAKHPANDTWPHLYVGDLWQAPKSRIALSPTSLRFSMEKGKSDPADKPVTVTNAADGVLKMVTPSITYGGSTTGWLSIDNSASAPNNRQVLTNSINAGPLDPGTYTASVEVRVADASNSPQRYTVTLVISAPPVENRGEPTILLSPQALDFTVAAGSEADPQIIAVDNGTAGSGDLPKVATSIEYLTGSDWLKVDTSDSTTGQQLSNRVIAGGLVPNTYAATVNVSAEGAANSPQTYAVSLTVTADLVLNAPDLQLKINSGGRSTVDGWIGEHAYRSGGKAFDFAKGDDNIDVDLNGQPDPAPAAVYPTCIHGDHSYSFPVPNGTYQVRLHFYDDREVTPEMESDRGVTRHMDYTIEDQTVLDDFNIVLSAGGTKKAYVKEFLTQVADGDGLQIIANRDQGNDVFESAIEIIRVPPAPEAVSTSSPDSDAGIGSGPTVASDAGPSANGASSSGSAQSAETLSGGCSQAGASASFRGVLWLALFFLPLVRSRLRWSVSARDA